MMKTPKLIYSEKKEMSGKLDDVLTAICNCGEEKEVTFRNLKNKWPQCKKCNQPMRIKSNADTFI